MKRMLLSAAGAAALAVLGQTATAQTVEKGKPTSMVLLPKFLGIAPFDLARRGAEAAKTELGNPTPLQYLGSTPENSVAGQIEIITNATTQNVNAIMISNNSGDQIVPAVKAAKSKGMAVVTWDSPIPSGEGEDLFVAQVDFAETGKVLADMALNVLGPEGGKFVILSASPDAANQNSWIASMRSALKDPKYAKLQEAGIVYGNDQSELSYNQALAAVDKYPGLKLIVAPTTVGIAATAKAMQDEGLCDRVKVTGIGMPNEMLSYTMNGCAPQFTLWSFPDLGYLAYHAAYGLANRAFKAEVGAKLKAGRLGEYTVEKDPTRPKGLRIVMGPFAIYDKNNIEAAAK